MKIAHFADVHFRGLARHNEYKEAFTDAFRTLRQIKPDIIYIGGDIVHSKTQGITPELIDILTWWFNSMTEIAPVYVLLGNHDGLIMNKSRQDAVTPIIAAIDNPRIKLMKASGVYETEDDDFVFCAFSLFDREGWKNVSPQDGKTNIALFHGAVKGALSDTDFELEGEINLNFFERYDYSLLGDIHKRQFLNNKRTIAYCGSTIQQNYSEELVKGFLLWDIRSRNDFDVKFHQVKSVNPFITVEWTGSKSDRSQIKSLQQGSRVRIDVKSRDTSGLKDFCELITKEVTPFEITYKTSVDVETSRQDGVVNVADTIDVKQALIDFIKRRDLPADVSKEALERLESYMSQRQDAEEAIRNVKWDLRRIEFDNLFSYGEGNYIDFDTMPGITGIFGRNRSGKSSIIGAIVYALYNTTDRGSMKNLHVINAKKNDCRAKVSLTVSSDDYEISRQTTKNFPKKAEVWASTTLSVTKVSTGETVDLNDEQRRETEKVLRRLIGTSDDFFYTCLAPQGNMNLFINEKSTARKQMLTRFLDIDYLEDLHNQVKSDISPYKSKIKMIGSSLDCKARIDSCNTEISNLIDERDDKIHKAEMVRAELAELNSNVPKDLVKDKLEIGRLEKLVDTARAESAKLEKEIGELNTHLADLKLKLSKVDNALDGIDFNELEKSAQDQRDIVSQIDAEERDLKSKRRERDILLKSVELLSEVPCMGQFPTCQFICDSHSNKGKLPAIENQIGLKERTIEIMRSRSASLEKENPASALGKAKKIKELQRDLQVDVKTTSAKIELAGERLSTKLSEINLNEDRLTDLRESVAGVDLPDGQKIDKLTSQLKQIEKSTLDIAAQIGTQTEKIRRLNEQVDEIDSAQSTLRVLETLEAAFSKKGVPQEIISSALPRINAEISNILTGIAGFTVEIECDDSNSVEIYLDYGDSRRLIELGSGMEKMISSIAIRVALTNISSLPKSTMLIIDEGFGALDDSNLEACARLLTNLKSYFKNILIISHVDAIKDIVDNVIDISWVDGYAKVTCD
jgi:DNA repair exonuclease SbcCD ATPase subunit/DNA repair exonuclease SbcCD nuclease subunit